MNLKFWFELSEILNKSLGFSGLLILIPLFFDPVELGNYDRVQNRELATNSSRGDQQPAPGGNSVR